MNRYQKIDGWIKEVVAFMVGMAFASVLSYDYHLGNWLGTVGLVFVLVVSAFMLVGLYVARKAKA